MSEHERVKIDGERHYKINGNPYPSVTTVTGWHPKKKEAINNWEENVGEEFAHQYKNEKAVLGTVVHHRALNPLTPKRLPKPEIDFQYVYDGIVEDAEVALALWDKLDLDLNPTYVEERVAHHGHEYAGTFDLLSDGTVMDLKTSPAIRDSHRWQIAAYYYALHHLDGYDDPENAAIIRLDPDPESNPSLEPHVEWLDRDDLSDAFAVFTETLERYGN